MPEETEAQIEQRKKFIQNCTLVLACSATAVLTYAFTRDAAKVKRTKEYLKNLRNEMHEIEMQDWLRSEFIEGKQLTDEYKKFAKAYEPYLN